jgi:AAA15 family ATPase/GTPase
MLLRFSVSNFRSIGEKQELNMLASSSVKNGHTFSHLTLKKEKVLPVALIYGANASGKSNLLEAFNFFKKAIDKSYSNWKLGEEISITRFLLDDEIKNKDSEFEIEFLLENKRYVYGFACNRDKFSTEYLYQIIGNESILVFDRPSSKGEIQFAKTLTGENKSISNMLRENSLFLSAAAQNNHQYLIPLNMYLTFLEFEDSKNAPPFINVNEYYREKAMRHHTINFLNELNTGVFNFESKEIILSEEEKIIKEKFQNNLIKLFTDIQIVDPKEVFRENTKSFKFTHKNSSDIEVPFNLNLESEGTLRLAILLDKIYWTLETGSLILIDEINSALHTKAAEAIISLFLNSDTNPNGAQLIATTHDTNLLRSKMLRKDEIWFTEKSTKGQTMLYSLNDFKINPKDDIEKDYLLGRYGAVPFAGSLDLHFMEKAK